MDLRLCYWSNPLQVRIVFSRKCSPFLMLFDASLILTRVRPSIWVSPPFPPISEQYSHSHQIPTMELIWSVLTMVLSTSKGFNSVIAIRFFIGSLSSIWIYTARLTNHRMTRSGRVFFLSSDAICDRFMVQGWRARQTGLHISCIFIQLFGMLPSFTSRLTGCRISRNDIHWIYAGSRLRRTKWCPWAFWLEM